MNPPDFVSLYYYVKYTQTRTTEPSARKNSPVDTPNREAYATFTHMNIDFSCGFIVGVVKFPLICVGTKYLVARTRSFHLNSVHTTGVQRCTLNRTLRVPRSLAVAAAGWARGSHGAHAERHRGEPLRPRGAEAEGGRGRGSPPPPPPPARPEKPPARACRRKRAAPRSGCPSRSRCLRRPLRRQRATRSATAAAKAATTATVGARMRLQTTEKTHGITAKVRGAQGNSKPDPAFEERTRPRCDLASFRERACLD
eukprot:SAG22_NODE_95_length_20791_cov_40.318514_3_plen_255_part_00